ncbi:MAG: ArsR/SmtB family transcription factor [Thermodesulfobacteriota bacterium]
MDKDYKDLELAMMFKALAAPVRIAMVQLLKNRTLCVGALANRLGITPGAVSQHLRILRDAGLLEADKRGYFVHYRVKPQTLAKWKTAMGAFLEPGGAEETYQLIETGEGICAKKSRPVRNRKN